MSAYIVIKSILTNTTMPRWPLHSNRDETVQIAVTARNSNLYNSWEAYAKCYGPSVISVTVTKGGHPRGGGLYGTSGTMGRGVSRVT